MAKNTKEKIHMNIGIFVCVHMSIFKGYTYLFIYTHI